MTLGAKLGPMYHSIKGGTARGTGRTKNSSITHPRNLIGYYW